MLIDRESKVQWYSSNP